jgi:hypothetical protein
VQIAANFAYFGLIWWLISSAALFWVALRFGRTLLPGCVPLIEQIARISTPYLTAKLVRYQRRLTLVWCLYLMACAFYVLMSSPTLGLQSASVGLCSALLFLSEYWLRPYFFPLEKFPSIFSQLRDTFQVLRFSALTGASLQGKDH